jgi:hypothetical protein
LIIRFTAANFRVCFALPWGISYQTHQATSPLCYSGDGDDGVELSKIESVEQVSSVIHGLGLELERFQDFFEWRISKVTWSPRFYSSSFCPICFRLDHYSRASTSGHG